MSDTTETRDGEPPAPQPAAPAEERTMQELQTDNRTLREQLEAFRDADERRRLREQQLAEREEADRRLRHDLAELALADALRAAARDVGVDPDLAATQAHRFQTDVTEDGAVEISPNPAETLLELKRTDPAFRSPRPAGPGRRPAGGDAPAVDEGDPVDLLGYLDRNPARRYEYIRRHGREKFFQLLRTARRRGYRRAGA